MESLWLSGRASEHGIQRSEVQFLIGTQNFFFSHAHDKTKTHLSLLHNRGPMVKTKMHRLQTATDLVILLSFFNLLTCP